MNNTKADAKDRAWRTFLQNIWLDVCIFMGPLVYDAVADSEGIGTKQYWTVTGISVGKTFLLVLIAYVMRLKKAPAAQAAVNPGSDSQ